jgi:hypothetical protein
MLPVLKAFAFREYALAGGSSQPCIVSAIDENDNIDNYVVKIYQAQNLHHTCKEVYAAFLAQHFDLKMPDPVLMEIDRSMICDLKMQPKYQAWKVTEGVFFASKYVENANSFTDALPLKNYEEQMGNIFAFDVLIMNVDRQVGKPNVLVKNQDIYVIDHELSMNIEHSFEDYLKQNRWDYSIKQNRGGHLFRQALIIMKKRNLNFDEFSEYLRNLRPESLYDYAQQLAKYEHQTLDIGKIVSYLHEVKRKESTFLALLHQLLE